MTIPPTPPVAFRLRRPYANEEEFIAGDGFAVYRSGMVLIGAGSRPVGLIVRFEIALWDGSPLLRGEGKVVVHRAAMEEGKPPGLEIRFTRLDARGKALVDRILQEREAPRSADVPDLVAPSIPPLSMPPPSLVPLAPLEKPLSLVPPSPPSLEVEPTQFVPPVEPVPEAAPDTERGAIPEPPLSQLLVEPPPEPTVLIAPPVPSPVAAPTEREQLLGRLRARGGQPVAAPPERAHFLGQLRAREMHLSPGGSRETWRAGGERAKGNSRGMIAAGEGTNALISEETIRLVRDRTDIQAVVGETVKLTRRGRSWIGLCPFHKERSPSFHVTPERGIFHCFGCGEHGNAFDFLMKVEGLSFPESVRRLADRAGVEITENRSPAARREEDAARKLREDLFAINALAASFFEQMMAEHPHGKLAIEELARRGLIPSTPTDVIATALQSFRVGYAPAEWAGLAAFLRQQGVSPNAAEQAGLLLPRASGGGFYDRFRNRLMFAVVDLQGRVVGFSGRVLPDPQTGITDKETGKYINSPETPVYRKGELVFGLFQARQAIRQAERAVLVEGNFDVVSLHARGIPNVVAPLGTAFTPEQATAIKRFAPEIILLFDGDAAGRKAVKAAREPCKKAGLVAKAATLPEGIDPDELSRDRGPEAVISVIQASRGLLEHLVDACLDARFTSASAEERAERLREVVELINGEDDPTVRAMAQQFADDVARRLVQRDDAMGLADATTFRALVRAVQAGVRQGAASAPSEHEATPSAPRDPVTEEVLGALLDFPSLLEEVPEEHWSCISGDAALVVAVLQETHPEQDAEKFLANLPSSFQSFALQRLTAPVYSDLTTAKTQLEANLRKLKVRALQQEHALLKSEAARAERQGDFDAELASLREIEERTRLRMQLRSRGPGGAGGAQGSK